MGIRSIIRILQISATTLLKRIIAISNTLSLPVLKHRSKYEIDELCIFIKSKRRVWIVYAFERETKKIVSFTVGSRINLTLSKVVDQVLNTNLQTIFTDKLKGYQSLISPSIHRIVRYGTRGNLTLRTHLKRLNRKTICFSKS